jgi:hypothetical protein
MVTGVKAGIGFCSGWLVVWVYGLVPPRGCELYVGGHNPGFAIMGVVGPISPVLGVCGDGYGGV